MTAFIRALFFYHASLKEDVKWDLFHSCQQCVTLISSPMPSFDTLEESTGERSKARDHMKRTLKRSSLMCSDSPWQCGGVVIFLFALLKQRIKRCLTLSGCCAILPWRGDNTQLQGSVTYYNFVSPLITAYISLPGHSWLQFQWIYFLCWWKIYLFILQMPFGQHRNNVLKVTVNLHPKKYMNGEKLYYVYGNCVIFILVWRNCQGGCAHWISFMFLEFWNYLLVDYIY